LEPNAIAALVSNFISGFAMTWLRGYHWFTEGATYALALAGGLLIAGLTSKVAHGGNAGIGDWIVDTMTYTLVVIGSVKVGGDVARARATKTDIPAAVIPQFSEISKTKEEEKP
jgi:hypothetical protein